MAAGYGLGSEDLPEVVVLVRRALSAASSTWFLLFSNLSTEESEVSVDLGVGLAAAESVEVRSWVVEDETDFTSSSTSGAQQTVEEFLLTANGDNASVSGGMVEVCLAPLSVCLVEVTAALPSSVSRPVVAGPERGSPAFVEQVRDELACSPLAEVVAGALAALAKEAMAGGDEEEEWEARALLWAFARDPLGFLRDGGHG